MRQRLTLCRRVNEYLAERSCRRYIVAHRSLLGLPALRSLALSLAALHLLSGATPLGATEPPKLPQSLLGDHLTSDEIVALLSGSTAASILYDSGETYSGVARWEGTGTGRWWQSQVVIDTIDQLPQRAEMIAERTSSGSRLHLTWRVDDHDQYCRQPEKRLVVLLPVGVERCVFIYRVDSDTYYFTTNDANHTVVSVERFPLPIADAK